MSFDQIGGLPLHPLVLHAVVVGVPLMAIASVAVAARPAWRARLAWPVVVLNALLVGATWVTAEAGEALAARVGAESVVEHSALGERLVLFVGALLVASVLPALAGRDRRVLGLVGLVLTVVTGVAAVWWTYRVGDSGAEAVWGFVIESTSP